MGHEDQRTDLGEREQAQGARERSQVLPRPERGDGLSGEDALASLAQNLHGGEVERGDGQLGKNNDRPPAERVPGECEQDGADRQTREQGYEPVPSGSLPPQVEDKSDGGAPRGGAPRSGASHDSSRPVTDAKTSARSASREWSVRTVRVRSAS